MPKGKMTAEQKKIAAAKRAATIAAKKAAAAEKPAVVVADETPDVIRVSVTFSQDEYVKEYTSKGEKKTRTIPALSIQRYLETDRVTNELFSNWVIYQLARFQVSQKMRSGAKFDQTRDVSMDICIERKGVKLVRKDGLKVTTNQRTLEFMVDNYPEDVLQLFADANRSLEFYNDRNAIKNSFKSVRVVDIVPPTQLQVAANGQLEEATVVE